MNPVGIVIFVVVYALISARRLSVLGFDRPAFALLGAVACVVTGVLTPDSALAAVDGSTLLLLFGMMGMGAFLAADGFFDDIEDAMVRIGNTPGRLLLLLVFGAGLLGALITNDAVCVLGTPLVVRLVQRHRLPPLPFLLALATAANTGSVATLTGNPQNMLCAILGDLSYRDHLLLMGPVAIAGLLVNYALLRWLFRSALAHRALTPSNRRPAVNRRTGITLLVILASAIACIAGWDLSFAATTGFVVLMLIHRRDTATLWGRIDWSLLLFFAGLFVVVEGFARSGGPAWLFARFPLAHGPGGFFGTLRLSGIFLLGSNIVSNVPFILVVKDQMAALPDPRFGWELLTMASTFAGNLTLLGSVANIIVAQGAKDVGGIGFFDYLKVGLPLAVLTTLMGTCWLWMVG